MSRYSHGTDRTEPACRRRGRSRTMEARMPRSRSPSLSVRTGRCTRSMTGRRSPPGLPHYGHILTSYVKDVVPRYFTMRGYRRAEALGLGLPRAARSNTRWKRSSGCLAPARSRPSASSDSPKRAVALVLRYANEWERIVTRLGRWVDFEHAYRTMDRSYMDSVLWSFRRLHELGLVYEGHKVVPYCCRCQTPLSNFEARLDDAYRPRTRSVLHGEVPPPRRPDGVLPGVDDDAVDPARQRGTRR